MNDQPARSSDDPADAPAGAPLGESVASSSQRIELLIEAAARAAAGIIADAEAQARSYLEESRARADQNANERSAGLSELADSLMTRAESVKQQSADLIEALEGARAQIAARLSEDVSIPPISESPAAQGAAGSEGADAAPASVAPAEPAETAEPEVEAAAEPEPETSDPEPEPEPVAEEPPRPAPPAAVTPRQSGPPSAGARLLATQMAVAGSTREEIASRLENEFGIADPDEMLDGILGPRS